MPYGEAWALQRALLVARQEDRIPDTVLLVEHLPVVTIGRGGRADHLLVPREALDARGVALFNVERGGDVTYHGPGQLVGYPILNLRALDEDVVRYVRLLESALIAALETWGIRGERVRGYPGVWVGGAKVAAIGVAVKRKVTMHGFALNVDPDLSYFDLINPCGLGKPVTSVARLLGRSISLVDARGPVARALGDALGIRWAPIVVGELEVHLAAAEAEAEAPPA